jgi:hypothetical protein
MGVAGLRDGCAVGISRFDASTARRTCAGYRTVRRWPSAVVWALALNAAITVPLAAVLNIWQDEAYTMHTTSRSLHYAFTQAVGFEQNAPLYFVTVDLWRHLDGSLFFGRFFSILCILGTIALVPALCARYLPGMRADWVTIVIALNPFTVYAALDMRVYAMVILLSTLVLLWFYDAFVRTPPRKPVRATLLWALLVAVGLYTQYYLAFLIAATGAALIFARPASLGRYVAGTLLGILAFLPMVWVLPGQINNFDGAFTAPTLAGTVASCIRILAGYVLPLHALGHSHVTYALAAMALVIAAFAARRSFRASGDALVLAITGSAAALFCIGLYVEHVVMFIRHLAFLFVPAILSVFALSTFLERRASRRAAAAWSLGSVALAAAVLVSSYHSLANPGDWKRVARYLETRDDGDAPIAVFEAENALPLRYYYRGSGSIVPVPAAVTFTRYRVRDFIVRSSAQLRRTMPRSQRIWLVTAGDCKAQSIVFGCSVVADYIARHYRVLSSANFYKSRVELLEAEDRRNVASSPTR